MSWLEDGRWELIDGAAYMLATPNIAHQRISSELHRQLANFQKTAASGLVAGSGGNGDG